MGGERERGREGERERGAVKGRLGHSPFHFWAERGKKGWRVGFDG